METRFRGSSTIKHVEITSEYELPFNSGKQRARKAQKSREPPSLLSLFLVILFILSVFLFVRYVDFRVPTPLTASDIADHPNRFIEERARNDLITLISVGSRVSGSHENDIATVDSLSRIIKEIQRTKFAVHSLEFDVQKPIGSFHMGFQDGLTSSYSNIPNVIVKLDPAGRPSNNSILVNCHFDSTPASPGASDDMVSCAVMLEALRVITRQSKPLKNTIVFLFNGAEENVLQGSHGFLEGKTAGSNEKGHKWAKNLKTFINLEAAGAGAREILFQTGPGNGWLLDAYHKVPYPWGSVVGEEIFQKGLIPSDTDFRIFRDYAKIPGLDFAFVKNGFVYHTKFDDINAISPGSIQHEGENVMALIDHLGNLDFSEIQFSDQKMVFYDVFGLFMISYSETKAIILNMTISVIVLIIAWKEAEGSYSTMGIHVLVTFGAWIAGIIAAVSVGIFFNVVGLYSPFHSYPMSVFLLFGIPCLIGQVVVYSVGLKGSEDFTWIAGKTTVALVLLLSTCFTRIVFNLMINLIFGVVGWFGARKLFKGYQSRLPFYLIVGEAFPLAMSLYLVTGCIDTFVPIMGRAGSEANPSVFVAVLTSFTMTIPAFTGIVPIFVFFKKSFLRGASIFMVLLVVGIALLIGRVPYTDKTPLRLHVVEVDRSYFGSDLTTVQKQDAGYWFFNIDSNIPPLWDEFGTHLKLGTPEQVDAFDCEHLYCGLPYFFPVKKLLRRTQWIPKKEGLASEIKDRVRLDITEDSFISPSVRRVTFSFIGSDHMTINFSPGENFDISKWSLTENVPPPMSMLWKGRPTYFVFHARGVNFERFNVTMEFRRKDAAAQNSDGRLVDITYASFSLHGEEMKSSDMKQLIRKLPSWIHPLGWSAVTQVYSIPA